MNERTGWDRRLASYRQHHAAQAGQQVCEAVSLTQAADGSDNTSTTNSADASLYVVVWDRSTHAPVKQCADDESENERAP